MLKTIVYFLRCSGKAVHGIHFKEKKKCWGCRSWNLTCTKPWVPSQERKEKRRKREVEWEGEGKKKREEQERRKWESRNSSYYVGFPIYYVSCPQISHRFCNCKMLNSYITFYNLAEFSKHYYTLRQNGVGTVAQPYNPNYSGGKDL